jgi:hypothetical protein
VRWFPSNVSGRKAPLEAKDTSPAMIRRTEIVVERTICSVDLHGSVSLHPGDRCPVCGTVLQPAEAEGVRLAQGHPTPELPEPTAHETSDPPGGSK